MTDTTPKAALVALIKERSFQSGAKVKLASGRTSQFYFNMKPTMLHPQGAHLIAPALWICTAPVGNCWLLLNSVALSAAC